MRILPRLEDLLSLAPEELGGLILLLLGESRRTDDLVSLSEVTQRDEVQGLGGGRQLRKAFGEGWAWLVAEGLIVRDPDQPGSWHFISRRGKALLSREAFKAYLSNRALQKELLHPVIAERAWSSFLRGDYDSAVFAAFREVEIQVRELGKFPEETVGVQLMRSAFKVDGGPLAPKDRPPAEREALLALFAGAIGWFKNPQSHRVVGLTQMHLAAQSLMFASHLLHLAEANT